MVAKRLLPVLLLAAGLANAHGQQTDLERIFQNQNLETLIDQALQLNITAKVLPPDQSKAWNSESSKITIPGRSVAVRLVGNNIRVEAVFTPYHEEDGNLILVAQGQVWLSDTSDKATRYVTTFKSLPVSLGEKVLFFPLGLSKEDSQTFTLQLEVEVFPYKKALKTQSN